MLLLSIFFSLISIATTNLSNDTDPNHQLIVISESWFSKDVASTSPDDFTIFLQQENSKDNNLETIYTNQDNPDDIFRNQHFDNGDPLVILEKGEDGLNSNQKQIYIVLRQTKINPRQYTAHVAYIREINGTKDVEWDNYNPNIKRENANFFATFSPFDSGLDSVTRKYNSKPSMKHGGQSINPDLFPFTLFVDKGKRIPDENSKNTLPVANTITLPISISALLDEADIAEIRNLKTSTSPPTISTSTTENSWKVEFLPIENNRAGVDAAASVTTTEANEDPIGLTVKLKCPPNSGAVLLGRKCFCPEGTIKIDKKCEKKSNENEQRNNLVAGGSFEGVAVNENGGSNYESLDINFRCPPNSGAVLFKRRCFCPKGTILKDKKCITDENLKTSAENNGDVDSMQNKGRSTRNAVPKKSVIKLIGRVAGTKKSPPPPPASNTPKGRTLVPVVPVTFAPLANFSVPNGRISGATGSFYNIGKRKMLPSNFDQSLLIGNAAQNSTHFEDTTPFTGLLTCDYQRPNENELISKANSSDIIGALVSFYLNSLRAQCHHEIEANTLRLFGMRIVTVGDTLRVKLNSAHEIFTRRIFSVLDWNNVISGVFLSLYSEAYREQVEKLPIKSESGATTTTSPGGKEISHSIYTLTLMIDKAIKLLDKEMKFHSLKFVNSLISALNERLLKVLREKEQLLFDCNQCEKEQMILNQNENQVRGLIDFIMYISADFRKLTMSDTHKTFADYYRSHNLQNSSPQSLGRNMVQKGTPPKSPSFG